MIFLIDNEKFIGDTYIYMKLLNNLWSKYNLYILEVLVYKNQMQQQNKQRLNDLVADLEIAMEQELQEEIEKQKQNNNY